MAISYLASAPLHERRPIVQLGVDDDGGCIVVRVMQNNWIVEEVSLTETASRRIADAVLARSASEAEAR